MVSSLLMRRHLITLRSVAVLFSCKSFVNENYAEVCYLYRTGHLYPLSPYIVMEMQGMTYPKYLYIELFSGIGITSVY